MVSTLKKRDLLSLAVWKDPPVCDVSVDLCKYKGSVVLHLQVSLLNGRHWTWTAAEHAWGANLHWLCVPSRQKKVKGGSVPSLLSCGVGSKICHPLFPFGRSCLLIQDSTQQWKFLNQRGENRIQHRELAAVLSKILSLVPPVAVLPTVEGVHQVHAEVPVHVMSRAEVGDEACRDSQTAQDCEAIRWVWSSTRGAVDIGRSLTCARHTSKHPALAVLHRPGTRAAPLPKDRDTAGPFAWNHSFGVRRFPFPS